jgi:hypothetical protein
MANLLGSLVGTPIASGAGFAAVPNRFANGSDDLLIRDTVLTAGNVIGDTVTLGTFKSTAFIDPASAIYFDAFGAGATLNIGDVNHVNGLTAAVSIAAAGSASLNGAFSAAKMGYPLWQRLGYASDPGGLITLIATFAGANPANANLAWKIVGKNS